MYNKHSSYLIRNGIDLDIYKPTINKNETIFQILGVSNPWSKEKGLYDIFKLRELLPINKYNITLVGLNQKQIKSLPDGISGILRTNNQQELVDLYSSSHVFINPTYADTFPTTNLEALACGTPVVTYNTGGSPEAINEQTGIVVEQGNIKQLAEAIINIENNPKLPNICKDRANLLFNKNECFKHYIDLYESLI